MRYFKPAVKVEFENLTRYIYFAENGLPVQMDGSLRLNVMAYDGTLLRSFALGEYILQSGYDWNAEDLEDIRIEVDIVHSSLLLYSSDKVTRYFTVDL